MNDKPICPQEAGEPSFEVDRRGFVAIEGESVATTKGDAPPLESSLVEVSPPTKAPLSKRARPKTGMSSLRQWCFPWKVHFSHLVQL